jgi:hypothetical protein
MFEYFSGDEMLIKVPSTPNKPKRGLRKRRHNEDDIMNNQQLMGNMTLSGITA